MGLYAWICRTLCTREIAAAAERMRREQEDELNEMKRQAARQTHPGKVREVAAEKLAKLSSVGVALLLGGCGQQLTPAQQQRVDVFQCRVAAVSTVVCGLFEPESLVRDIMLGKVNPTAALIGAGATAAEVVEAAKAWNACAPVNRPVEGG